MAATATKPKPTGKVLDDGTLMIHGVIGDEFDGLDSATVVEEIHDLGEADELRVNVNSPGGMVSDGIAIYTELATHPADVVVEITGLAASMASAIAMAGDVIRIAENGLVMIHNPWNVAVGDSDDLRKAAEILDKFGDSLVGIYAKRTGLDEDEIRDLMAEETWMDAEEALEKGFVDEIMEASDPEAFSDLDVSELAHVPAALNRLIREGRQMAKARAQSTDGDPPNAGASPPADDSAGGAEPSADLDLTPQIDAALDARDERNRQRRKDIAALAEQVGLPSSWADERYRDGDSIEDARAEALDALTTRQENGGPSFVPGGVTVDRDGRDKWLEGMANWLVTKGGQAGMVAAHTGERPDPGEFRGMSLLDIARDSLERRKPGSTRGMGREEVVRNALIGGPRAENAGLGTRSDFPVLLENVLHKMLMAAYDTAPDQWRSVAAVGSVSDFRDHPRLKLGSLPVLDDKLKSGEFRYLHFPDAEKETIAASTKGNLIGLTRPAIINDDVDGFSRLVRMLGRAAARSVEKALFDTLALNSGLGPTMGDGNTLFHADHDNLETTEEGPPTIDAFEAARVLMAQQQDPDGNDFLNLRPEVFVGPIGLGADARTAVDAQFDFDAETSGNSGQFQKPNVVRDMLDTIVDTPRLSGTRWYLFADPDIAPVLEVVFLDGMESPEIRVQDGFDYDGIRWRVLFDFGTGAIDFRGAVTNDGSA